MAGVMSCGKALEQFTQILLNLYNCRQTKIQCHIVLAEDTIKGNREGYILR